MRQAHVAVTVIALLCLGSIARADIFDLGTGLTNLQMVTVGDPGNAGELSGAGAGGFGQNRNCGSVTYSYQMGKCEVTAAQYCEFLNDKAKSDPHQLYNSDMGASIEYYSSCAIRRSGSDGGYTYSVAEDWANRPVNYVNYWNACRFANWLNNGQGNGDTETGAYTLDCYNGDDGRSIARNAGAKWFLPNVDEWYKAAYYKSGGTNAGYWDYPTQSDEIPSNVVVDPEDSGNRANFYWYLGSYTIGKPYWRTNVGEFENSASAYGTFDQAGNVCEWNEELIQYGKSYRSLPGGSFRSAYGPLRASTHGYDYGLPTGESSSVGFRVAYMPEGWTPLVPEPSCVAGILCGMCGLGVCRMLFKA